MKKDQSSIPCNVTLKEMPKDERPYEKCEEFGPGHLSDAELLAVIIRAGTKEMRATQLASYILSHHPVYKGIAGINYFTINELTKIKGVGRVKAIQILCIAELSKRIAKASVKDGLQFHSPSSIADYYMESTRFLRREQMMLLLFDSKNKLMKEITISKGTVNSSLASPREILIEALRYEAVFMILLHNHPSGNPNPSLPDLEVTKRIKEAGELVGIKLSDHIILGEHCYVSLRERGVI